MGVICRYIKLPVRSTDNYVVPVLAEKRASLTFTKLVLPFRHCWAQSPKIVNTLYVPDSQPSWGSSVSAYADAGLTPFQSQRPCVISRRRCRESRGCATNRSTVQ